MPLLMALTSMLHLSQHIYSIDSQSVCTVALTSCTAVCLQLLAAAG
jgi:hypothetical protein